MWQTFGVQKITLIENLIGLDWKNDSNDTLAYDDKAHKAVVKLHSELALPTESQLDRVGVDFVFPPSQQLSK